jgi:hypothetical protein
MFETIIASILLGKIKHYKIHYLFRTWTVYPVLLTQCVLIYLQITVFLNNYSFIQYAPIIKTAVILSFLFPIINFKLYKPAIVGSISILIGTVLNKFVMSQNGGKMPVFPTLSYLTGYVKLNTFSSVNDIHILGSSSSHFKILTDYIDLGYSVLSPGDLFIHFFSFWLLYSTLKAINLHYDKVLPKVEG